MQVVRDAFAQALGDCATAVTHDVFKVGACAWAVHALAWARPGRYMVDGAAMLTAQALTFPMWLSHSSLLHQPATLLVPSSMLSLMRPWRTCLC